MPPNDDIQPDVGDAGRLTIIWLHTPIGRGPRAHHAGRTVRARPVLIVPLRTVDLHDDGR
jgi:hypothetical protein